MKERKKTKKKKGKKWPRVLFSEIESEQGSLLPTTVLWMDPSQLACLIFKTPPSSLREQDIKERGRKKKSLSTRNLPVRARLHCEIVIRYSTRMTLWPLSLKGQEQPRQNQDVGWVGVCLERSCYLKSAQTVIRISHHHMVKGTLCEWSLRRIQQEVYLTTLHPLF